MKTLARIWFIVSVITVLGGCQKGELRENNVSDESKVAIELSAGSPVSVVSKAAVEKWNDSEVNVFGLKRKRGVAVGDNAYDFTDPDSFVDYPTTAAAGTSASLEVYADKEKEIPYFYTEGRVYDFYGYHLGGATATDKNISGDTYSYSVTFLGNNDLMYADTDRAEDILTSNDPSVTESDVYSAWAARRNIHPTLVFHHALTRLNFIVKGKGNKWQDVAITGVDVKSVNAGTLAVTGTNIGFIPSEDTPVVLSLKTAADEDLVSEDVTLNPDDVALGGEGACLMIAPDMDEIEVTVHMKHKDYEDIPLADYTFTVNASDVSKKDEYGNAVPVSRFEAGHAYDFYINVYGPEEIVITAQITDWEDGGDYTYDPDDDFRPGSGTDPETEPEVLHKVTGVQVYDDGQYYGVIKFGYDEQDRLTSIEAVYDNNTYFSAFDYSDEDIVKITGVLGDDDLPTIVIYDSDGTVSSIGDWEFTYYPEENKIVLYDDAEAIWYLEDGNVIAVYDKYDDVTQSYDYYAYKNNYSIDMNNILAVIAEWDYNYAPLPPFRMPSFTSANLLKQGKYGTYSYEFDEDGKVSSIEMISANVTYTLEPHYDSFDEIFDAFPELPSEEDSEVSGTVLPLDDSGNANCYVVSQSGSYSFLSVKGNSEESVGAVNSAAVLWESFGTDVAPNVGDLVTNVSFENGRVQFDVPSDYKEGNAVIAAMDADGTILWSWHIWLTDKPAEQVYYNNAGTMMDRNLGATSAAPGDVGALGLLYQWGRKDPFLGSAYIDANHVAKSTMVWPDSVVSSSSTGTIEYSIANPTVYITCLSDDYDWYYSGSLDTDDTRWRSTKTIYDPCPYGWRVPEGGNMYYNVWSKAIGSLGNTPYISDFPYDHTNKGINFTKKLGKDDNIWYPSAGYITYQGWVENVYKEGQYWSVATLNREGNIFAFTQNGSVYPFSATFRASGLSIRCVKNRNYPL